MRFLDAIELFGFAIGIVLQLSLFVLIRRYRRIEKLELLFLSLTACLFLWNTCRFLSLVFKITEFKPVSAILAILLEPAMALPSFCVLAFLPSLLLHTHLVFQQRFTKDQSSRPHPVWEFAAYLPLVAFPWALIDFFSSHQANQSILAATAYARPFAGWFALSLAISAFIDWRMMLQSQSAQLRNLFRTLIVIFLSVAGVIVYTYFFLNFWAELREGGILEALLMLWSTIPCVLIGYYIFQYNFLEIAIQRSFGYTFVGVLLLLVYLLCVTWLKEFLQKKYGLPAVVVENALIFALLGFAQPIKRWIDRTVNALFSLEVSKFETIASRLDDVSHSTVEMDKLLHYVEELLTKELDLNVVKIVLFSQPDQETHSQDGPSSEGGLEPLLLSTGRETLGEIRVESRSGKLSTQQEAALRFLITQIVAAIENCRLTEGKVRLERELAKRNEMATIGQMAKTVAHNIRNPLSAINTIVQLMREDADVGARHERDLALIGGEINRLDRSVTDLLRYPGPIVTTSVTLDLAEILEKMVLIFRAETDRRGIRLDLELDSRPLMVRGNEDVFAEVLQNLIVNALDAVPDRSRIHIRTQVLQRHHRREVVVWIDDEGPGIPPAIRQQIFKPFFTTKQKGTGLGLAVVLKRILDLDGEINCVSPIANGRGTRFEVILPFESPRGSQEPPS
jgi:signal transduction histidine kinase